MKIGKLKKNIQKITCKLLAGYFFVRAARAIYFFFPKYLHIKKTVVPLQR